MTTQICTTVEQSKRLLAAGASPETADMVYHHKNSRVPALEWELRCTPPVLRTTTKMNIDRLVSPLHKNPDGTLMTGEEVFDKIWGKDIPAWSLSKLIEMIPKSYQDNIDGMTYYLSGNFIEFMYSSELSTDEEGDKTYTCANSFNKENLFDNLVDAIEWLIKNGHFDKKWLVEKGGDK